jgi:2'-5' RNA ligase
MIRAFLAVELTEELRRQLGGIQHDLKQRLGHGRTKDIRISWVQPASMHLTVKFLGDTDEQLIEPLRTALAPVAARHLPLTLPLERLGVFPRSQQPRVLWVGPSEQWERGDEAGRLAEFHRSVEDCCRSFGFAPEDRPLNPHLTLARIKEGERHVGQAIAAGGFLDRPVALGVLTVASIVLMKSDLRPTGSIYTRLWDVR